MTKKIEKNFYYIALVALLIFFIVMSVIGAFKIYNLDIKNNNLLNQYNNIRGENIALKAQVDYETEQKEIYYRIIDEKVSCLNTALSRIYPGYDYRKKIQKAINDNSKINSLPESLIEIYIEQRLIIPHGLQNYQKAVPEIIWPLNPEQAYVTTKRSEYGSWRPYSYMANKHEGTDIQNPFSDAVKAVYDGIIYKVYYDEGGGWSIELKFQIKEKHYFARYRHVEKIYVDPGQVVTQKEVIASTGNTGFYSLSKHLHFELWEWTGRYYKNINPALNSTWGNKVITSIF